MENGILVEKKYYDVDPNELQIKNKKVLKWVPSSVAEYFFYDEYGFVNVSDRRILECYSELTSTLSEAYTRLKDLYVKFASKVLLEEEIINGEFPRIPKEMEQKGLEYYLDNEGK